MNSLERSNAVRRKPLFPTSVSNFSVGMEIQKRYPVSHRSQSSFIERLYHYSCARELSVCWGVKRGGKNILHNVGHDHLWGHPSFVGSSLQVSVGLVLEFYVGRFGNFQNGNALTS